MIQRIQTVWLLLALAFAVTCLCFPIGYYIADNGARLASVTNLWFAYSPEFVCEEMVARTARPWALFGLLIIVSLLTFVNIFLFRRRALQMRLCSFCTILLVSWYLLYAFFAVVMGRGLEAHFRPEWAGALPFAALVMEYLAFRGVARDEALVRSLDRLR